MPEYYLEGDEPRQGDTQHRLEQKMVSLLQTMGPDEGGGAVPLSLPLSDIDAGTAAGLGAHSSEVYGSVTHPDVLYIPEGFGGYTWWMAVTPYPDVARELPNIFASNDGVNWVVPPGASNPISLRQEAQDAMLAEFGTGTAAWMADTDLLYIDGVLHCYYCHFKTSGGTNWQWVRKTSTNGRTWSSRQIVLSGSTTTSHSPAFVPEGGSNVTAFYVKNTVPTTQFYRTSTDGGLTWSAEVACVFPLCSDDRPNQWHIDVIKVGETYHALMQDGTIGENSLWYYTSRDKVNWTLECHEPAVPISHPLVDGAGHYRSSLVAKEGGRFDVFVSGQPHGRATDSATGFPTLSVTADAGTDVMTAVDVNDLMYLDEGDEFQIASGTPPAPLALNTTYYAKTATNTTLQASLTKFGAAVNLTTTGASVRLSRRPWQLLLWRDVFLPIEQNVSFGRRALTNKRFGGSILTPVVYIAAAQTAWAAAEWGWGNRMRVEKTTRIRYFCLNVGVQSGSIEVGILRGWNTSHNFVYPLKTSGVIACPAAGLNKIDLGHITLPPGDYWLWVWANNTTFQTTHAYPGAPLSGLTGQANLVAASGLAMPKAGTTLDTNTGRFMSVFLMGDF